MTQLIAGILRLDGGAPDERLLRRMLAAMNTRGLPEAVRTSVRGPIALGAVSLRQPGADAPAAPGFAERDDGLAVADASIYARDRLDLALAGPGSPADLLLGIVAGPGPAGLGAVHGDFAFAAFIGGRLTLGRDHFGARPLHYAERPGEWVAFASLPGGLLHAGIAAWTVDDGVAASWTTSVSPPPGRTIFREVMAVPAAHVVECTPAAATPRRYWRLDPRPRLPFGSDPREIATEARRLMEQALRRRLPQAGACAGHLSGGLDSSPLAVLAARALNAQGRKFYGYTYAEPDDGPGLPGQGDAPMAARVAAYEPAISQVTIRAPCLLTAYAEGIEPDTMLPVSALEPEEQILRDAAGRGVSTMISGWGGDQVLSYQGRGTEADLLRAGRPVTLWRHLREESRGTGVAVPRLAVSTVAMQLIPQRMREALRSVAGRETPYLIGPRLQRLLVAERARGWILRETWPDDGDSHRIRRDMTESWYIQARLETFARQGARYGIVYSFPLLDLDLVEFALKVPGIFLRHGGQRRLLVRAACEGLLPEDVRLSHAKLRPFPGEQVRIAAACAPLLELLGRWGKNDRIRRYLDLDFMAEVIRAAADPAASGDLSQIDLTPAFQLAGMLEALEKAPE